MGRTNIKWVLSPRAYTYHTHINWDWSSQSFVEIRKLLVISNSLGPMSHVLPRTQERNTLVYKIAFRNHTKYVTPSVSLLTPLPHCNEVTFCDETQLRNFRNQNSRPRIREFWSFAPTTCRYDKNILWNTLSESATKPQPLSMRSLLLYNLSMHTDLSNRKFEVNTWNYTLL